MEQIHHIHHNFPTKAGRLAGVFKKRHPSSLSKKVCSPLGPLCEGDSPQRGEMSRSDRGAWARRAPPAGGGGENCTAARNISSNGNVLSLRPYGHLPTLWGGFLSCGRAKNDAAEGGTLGVPSVYACRKVFFVPSLQRRNRRNYKLLDKNTFLHKFDGVPFALRAYLCYNR